MTASQGDSFVVPGHEPGDEERRCDVLQAKGPDGGPPYFVRWADGELGMVFPGEEWQLIRPD
ncbi:MAG: DUF1918 domain-containing protein [Actinobacteria bacterium]|nr:DUF1918 domain-containing protein [Actinomycetota bacterium]